MISRVNTQESYIHVLTNTPTYSHMYVRIVFYICMFYKNEENSTK